MKHVMLVSLCVLATAGCNQNPAEKEVGTNAISANSASEMADRGVVANAADNAAMPMDAAGYLSRAGAGDLFEIESSRALLDKSKDAKVRHFAQMMVKAHQESTAKLKAAAADAKLEVAPPMLAADQQAMLDEIKGAGVDGIDAVYLTHQKAAHDAALALHLSYAGAGDVPSLKAAAAEIVAVVRKHIDGLSKLTAG